MKKTSDPREIALRDKIDKAQERFERLFSRLKRTFNALYRERERIIRMQRKLASEAPALVEVNGKGKRGA